MAGTHWGLAINSNSDHILILIISVTVVLILWVLWSSCQLSYCSIFLLPIYVLLWSIDFFLLKDKKSDFYFQMRTGVTLLVLLSLQLIYFKK